MRYKFEHFCIATVVAAWMATSLCVFAQESTPSEPAPQSSDDTSTGQPVERTSPMSFSDVIFREAGNRVGFSTGLFHTYSSTTAVTPEAFPKRIISFTSAQPRVYTRFQGRAYTLRLDYGFAYRRYHRNLKFDSTEHTTSMQFDHSRRNSHIHADYSYGAVSYTGRPTLDSSGHTANFRFDHQMSQKLSLQISNGAYRTSYTDSVRSSFSLDALSLSTAASLTDAGSFPSAALRALFADFAHDIFLKNELVTTNNARADLTYRWSPRSSVAAVASHEYINYETSFFNSQSVQAGVRADYQIKPWLFFDLSYSNYFSLSGAQRRSASIQRLQVVGLRHRTRTGLETFVSGGADYATQAGSDDVTASVYAGISKTTRNMTLSATYHRGFSQINGPGVLLTSNNVSGSLYAWLTRRLNAGVTGSYLRGNSSVSSGALNTRIGSGHVSFSLQRHLLLSAQYSYVYQRTGFLGTELDDVNRHVFSTGLQYFLPTLYR